MGWVMFPQKKSPGTCAVDPFGKRITLGVTELGSQVETLKIRVGPNTKKSAPSHEQRSCEDRHKEQRICLQVMGQQGLPAGLQKLVDAMEGWFFAIPFAMNIHPPQHTHATHFRLMSRAVYLDSYCVSRLSEGIPSNPWPLEMNT